jgi:hypothetical protein
MRTKPDKHYESIMVRSRFRFLTYFSCSRLAGSEETIIFLW